MGNSSSEVWEHFKLLSIFHYIVGAMTAVFACFSLIHPAIGIAMLCGYARP